MIRLYYHCQVDSVDWENGSSLVATSPDGLVFTSETDVIGHPYFRVFRWDGYWYALGMPGVLYRSSDGLRDFERGPTLFDEDMRHSAIKVDGDVASIFYTQVGEAPERVLLATIDLTADWMTWQESSPTVILEPETDYEGASLKLEPSARHAAVDPVRQLRDPAIFQEQGKTYLLYSVAGEFGIAIAELR